MPYSLVNLQLFMHWSYNESQANIQQGWAEIVAGRFVLKFNTAPKTVIETKQEESLPSSVLI